MSVGLKGTDRCPWNNRFVWYTDSN